MTNLKIGTILIAKEDFGEFTKCKEYPIVENNNDITYRVICNDEKSVNWFDERRINQYFTIKRYTLSDLQEKKIAVKLKSEEEFKRISTNDYSGWLYDAYFGYENGQFTFIGEENLPNYILLESIDEIDLGDEGKEEVVNECETDAIYIAKLETEISRLDEQIARLKGENEELETALRVTTKKLGDATSQDLTKRERMAWEYVLKSVGSIQGKTWSVKAETAFELVDTFLAKSKEVKP